MKGTAGKLMYETLRNYGVTHLFGLDEPVHVTQELDRDVIKPITVRDEKHGAIMAHGYSKVTHKPGVCTALQGPGATNLISGLAESLKSSTPVIALVTDVVTTSRGKNASQEIDHISLLRPVVKWIERIDNPNRIAEMTRKAFKMATSGRPGPVALVTPSDIMGAEAEAEVYAEPKCDRYPSWRVCPGRDTIEAAVHLMAEAKNPVIIAGGGCILSRAWDQVVELAELYNIPVATTMFGKGTIPDLHPLSIGVMGSYTGGKNGQGIIANQIVSEADVAFIIGSKTDEVPYFDWTLPKQGTRVIHLDIDPEEIGRNFETHVALNGDAQATLTEFIAYCKDKNVKMEVRTDKARIKKMKEELLERQRPLRASEQVPIRPEYICNVLSEYIDKDTVIAMDASFVCEWVMSYINNMSKGCNFLMPRAMAGIGWDLPAAMGAKIGRPEKTVISLTGDGAFGYVMNELETASRYNINVIEIVFNNSALGFQKYYEELLFGKSVECEFQDIDYSEVARALKCQGERVKSPQELKQAMERAFNANAPYVLDVVVDPKAIPPISWFDDFDPEEY